ncbi:MAG: hypothetical protein AAF917_08535 [Pseudomonadota bacterium]
MRWTAVPLSLLAFLLLLGLFLLWDREEDTVVPESTSSVKQAPSTPNSDSDPLPVEPETETSDAPEAPLPGEITKEVLRSCLKNTPRDQVPEIAQDMARLEPYMTRPKTLLDYRGQGIGQLQALAAQGDSTAMVVLATQYELNAMGLADRDPAVYLRDEAPAAQQGEPLDKLTPEARENIEQAIYWFREAALHGRYAALAEVGRLHFIVDRGPVELGWISQSDYNALADDQRWRWSPYNAYSEMVISLTADAWTGPNGDLAEIDGFFIRGAQSTLVDQLLNSFFEDTRNRGLPVRDIEPWQGRTLSEILGDFCPDVVEPAGS